MNKQIFSAFLLSIFVAYSNGLTCLSNVLGTTTTYGTATCPTGSNFCYRVTSTFTATATTLTGISYGLTATVSQPFVSGDKGCLPAFIATANSVQAVPAAFTGAAQTTTIPMTLGSLAGSLVGSMIIDMATLHFNLCTAFGTCCSTNNCNSADLFKANLVILALSVLIATFNF